MQRFDDGPSLAIASAMSCSRSLASGILACALLLAAGCSSSPMSRIDSNRAVYESWPLDVQQAVLEGRVIENMTHEQVEMALGKPSEKTVRNGRKGSEEVWTYGGSGGGGGGIPVTVGGVFGGVGVQGTRYPGSGGGGDYFEVVFVDGRVTRSTAP